MAHPEQLIGLQKRLTTAKELTDVLVLETLELCAIRPTKDIEKKYQLLELCHVAAWDQAALWVTVQVVPTWRTELSWYQGIAYAKLTSPHAPPFTIDISHARSAQALLIANTQAVYVLTRLGLATKLR